VAVYVFHHHNSVVHKNTYGKNQREKGYAVKRIPKHIINQQRKPQCNGNGNKHHQSLPHTQRQRYENRNRQRSQKHVKKQFVRLFLCGFAVVARNAPFNPLTFCLRFQLIKSRQHMFRHTGGV